jgi:hypothetical protein
MEISSGFVSTKTKLMNLVLQRWPTFPRTFLIIFPQKIEISKTILDRENIPRTKKHYNIIVYFLRLSPKNRSKSSVILYIIDKTNLLAALYAVTVATAMFVMPVIYHSSRSSML